MSRAGALNHRLSAELAEHLKAKDSGRREPHGRLAANLVTKVAGHADRPWAQHLAAVVYVRSLVANGRHWRSSIPTARNQAA